MMPLEELLAELQKAYDAKDDARFAAAVTCIKNFIADNYGEQDPNAAAAARAWSDYCADEESTS